MQKNSNAQAFTVENIVVKYIHTENQYSPDGFGFEYCAGDELIAQLYKDVAGEKAKKEVCSAVLRNGKEFYDDAITSAEYEFLKEHFAETVEYVISCRAALEDGIHEPGQLPNDAAEFAVKLLNLPKGSKVFLPNAGYGDAIMLLKGCSISGYVHSEYAWALIQIRLFAAGINADIECLRTAHYNYEKEGRRPNFPLKGSVDAIITMQVYHFFRPKYIFKEQELLDCLKEDGKMIMLVYGSTLCKNSSNASRRYVKAIIQFPYTLRVGYNFHRNDLCAIVYDKQKSITDEGIDVFNFTGLGKSVYIQEFDYKHPYGTMNVDEALAFFKNGKEYVKHLEKKDIDDDILLPTYYFVNRSQLCHPIGHLMTEIDYRRFYDDESNLSIPVVCAKNLSKDFSNACIGIESLDSAKNARNIWTGEIVDGTIVNQPCVFIKVIINDNSNDIIVGYIKDVPASGIVVEDGIMCLAPKTGVSLESATLLLLSDFVKKQIMAIHYVFGSKNFLSKIVVWPMVYEDDPTIGLSLNANDVEMKDQETATELTIKAMASELQNQKIANDLVIEAVVDNQVSQRQDNHKDSLSIGNDLDESSLSLNDDPEDDISFDDFLNAMGKDSLIGFIKNQMIKESEIRKQLIESVKKQREEIKKKQEEYKKNIHYRKHSLGQIFLNAQSNWDAMVSSMNQNDGVIDVKTVYGKKHPHTIGEITETLTRHLNSLGEGIENFTPEDDPLYKKKVVIDLAGFIREYMASNTNPNYSFEYINTDRSSCMKILFSERALKEILQNIIFNAWRHGFINRDNNIIRFELQSKDNMIDFIISNNGNPIDEDIMRKDIFRYGTTSKRGVVEDGHAHQGLGMFRAKCFMEDAGGSIDCISNRENKFPVSFILSFEPIKSRKYD